MSAASDALTRSIFEAILVGAAIMRRHSAGELSRAEMQVQIAAEAAGRARTLRAEVDALRAFAQAMMEDWPEGAPDGFALQDLAVKHGLLALKDPWPFEPCGDNCYCAEYHGGAEGMSEGVECFRKTPLLTGEAR
jgi:hypothetical protein